MLLIMFRLLGLSAFAGFVVLVVGWPLNNLVANRSVRIYKGLSTARDKRMGVLNELISAVKFIKFFAWEDRWIKRALDAREVEMQWMVKGACYGTYLGNWISYFSKLVSTLCSSR